MTAYETRIRYLLTQFADDKASEDEIYEMIDLLQAAGENSELESFLLELRAGLTNGQTSMPDLENLWQQVQFRKNQADAVLRMSWRRIAVAASILLLIGVGSYILFLRKPVHPNEVVKNSLPVDIKSPEANRATIILADGKKLYLDSVKNGTSVAQNNVNLVKLADGQIVYSGSTEKPTFNTLVNPRGSKVVDMTLTDGSHIWLNTGSSITYPISFTGNERAVSVTGEVYFEVKHDAGRPFKVSRGDMEVTVLGTHFNVNAYEDEGDVKVTLLEGSVKTSVANSQSLVLKPGQQAIVQNSRLTSRDNVNTEAVIAWKNGLFSFDRADLQTVMRQLTRWYDADAKYDGTIPQRTFGGDIGRDLSLSQVLKILEGNEVHFRIEGKTIVITP